LTLNHDLLLSKLYHYGIRGTPPDWFKNYLYDRTQFVKIDNTKSNYEMIVRGIPQGSTLGPLLFLLYVNDHVESLMMIQMCFTQDISDKLYHLETVMNEELKL